ncbi:MAG: hypothetical protein HW391_1296 [Chloroflexi bacterium]|nr:hypothetical protein [Chloroflexota bacterium]
MDPGTRFDLPNPSSNDGGATAEDRGAQAAAHGRPAEHARVGRAITLKPLVIGCGALARELVALTRRAGFPEVDLTCLPATLHNRPERIPEAVRARIRRARAAGRDRLFVAYADCGTGGLLDRVLEEEGVARLEGAHCYEVYAGRAAFAALSEEEPGTFYLTDFLARNFERLVIRGLGLDRHPELLPQYFGNYTRVVYLAQTADPLLTTAARRGARRLGLRFERRFVGYGELAPAMTGVAAMAGVAATLPPSHDAQLSRAAESPIRVLDQTRIDGSQESPTPSQRVLVRGPSGGARNRRAASHQRVTPKTVTGGHAAGASERAGRAMPGVAGAA